MRSATARDIHTHTAVVWQRLVELDSRVVDADAGDPVAPRTIRNRTVIPHSGAAGQDAAGTTPENLGHFSSSSNCPVPVMDTLARTKGSVHITINYGFGYSVRALTEATGATGISSTSM